jgi:CubicO group peptidase (beta-lactamase class C family)
MRLTFLLAPLLLATSVLGAQDTRQQRVDSLFSQYTRGVSPGLAVAVVKDGKVLMSKGYGMANLEHRIPITSSTVFDVASVSKQFTGLAVAMLVGEGRIALTDDIRKYIPELKTPDTITVDHLLHHTSGIRDWPGSLGLAGWRMDDVIAMDQIMDFASNQKTLNFAPGAEHMYSNTGYNLLAAMVARVSGKPFRLATNEKIFAPLGMTASHFQDDHRRVIPNRALGYGRVANGEFVAVTNNLTALGSSSLFSTADDMAKWLINLDDAKVGGPAAMALMRTPGKLNDGKSVPYAFGVSNGAYRGQPTVTHSGGWAAFSSYVIHFPEQHFGIVVLSNGGTSASRAATDVADIYLDRELTPRASTGVATSRVVARVAPATLDRYTGLYRLGTGWYVRIRREGEALLTQATREAEFPMTAISDTVFWVAAYNDHMTFRTLGGRTELFYRGRATPKLSESASLTAPLQELAGLYESDELGTAYSVELQGSGLVMRHRRHGTIGLTRLWGDEFGATRLVAAVEFLRDSSGKVTGLSVRVDDRSRNIRFVRRP